jgi:hypothetical protein
MNDAFRFVNIQAAESANAPSCRILTEIPGG